MTHARSLLLIVPIAAFALALTGCGGSSGMIHTLPPVKPQISISWPDRTRSVQSPGAALSAVITFQRASKSGADVAFTVNRTGSAAYMQTYTCPTQAKPGVFPMIVHFTAGQNGAGGEVATAAATVQISGSGQVLRGDGSPLGTIGFSSTLSSVTLLPNQVATVTQPYTIQISATDLKGNIVALSPGSATFRIKQGYKATIDSSGDLVAQASGTVTVQATADGVTGPYGDVIVLPPVATMRSLPLSSNAMVFNYQTGTLWASIPSTATSYGNQVVEINPASGAVLGGVVAGSEPGPLAISDDGSTLFAGMTPSVTIQPVATASRTLLTAFPLSNLQPYGDPPATSIQVQPGSTNSIAITRTPNTALGPELYINGVQAPNTLGLYTGTSLAFASPTELFSFDGYTSDYALIDATVDSQGLTEVGSSIQGLFQDFFVSIHYFGGRIYGSDGSVIDAASKARLARFAVPGVLFNQINVGYSNTVDVNARRAFIIAVDTLGNATLNAYDIDTFLPVGAVTLPNVAFDQAGSGFEPNLVRFGAKGLAFRTPTAIYFIDNAPGL